MSRKKEEQQSEKHLVENIRVAGLSTPDLEQTPAELRIGSVHTEVRK